MCSCTILCANDKHEYLDEVEWAGNETEILSNILGLPSEANVHPFQLSMISNMDWIAEDDDLFAKTVELTTTGTIRLEKIGGDSSDVFELDESAIADQDQLESMSAVVMSGEIDSLSGRIEYIQTDEAVSVSDQSGNISEQTDTVSQRVLTEVCMRNWNPLHPTFGWNAWTRIDTYRFYLRIRFRCRTTHWEKKRK